MQNKFLFVLHKVAKLEQLQTSANQHFEHYGLLKKLFTILGSQNV